MGALPVDGGDEVKQTNEIGMVIPLLEPLDIAGKTITADALLTQRKLAQYLLARNADYVFTVKGNQPILREDIRLATGQKNAAIEATADTAELAAYITGTEYPVWPSDSPAPVEPAPVDGLEPTGDQPEE